MAPDRRLTTRGWGGGRPGVVCWPGLTVTAAAHFDESGPLLADALECGVVAVEPPGWNSDPLPHDEYALSRLARQLVGLLDELELDRVAFVGWSWGASVGCHVAALEPGRLSALVLLDAGFTDLQDEPAFEERTLAETTALLEGQGFRFPSWEAYLEVMRGRTRSWRPALEARARAAMREDGDGIVPRVSLPAMAAAWHGVADEPPSATLPAIGRSGTPVLLVAATDTVATERGDAALRRFGERVPQVEVHTVDSSHDVLADAPRETVDLVTGWLRARRDPR